MKLPAELQDKIDEIKTAVAPRRNLFADTAVDPNETHETSRARVMKGIRGRIPAGPFERQMRAVRRKRKIDEEFESKTAGTKRAQTVLSDNMLHALTDPKKIAKRRAKKGIEIPSELADTPLGRKAAA